MNNIMAKKVKVKQLYWVDIYTSKGGHCYRSVYDVDWKGVLELKRLAKQCGGFIIYEKWGKQVTLW